MARFFYKIGNSRSLLWGFPQVREMATRDLGEAFLAKLRSGDELWGVSVVPSASKKMATWAHQRRLRFFEADRKTFPQKSCYATSLGLDRLVNMLAARSWGRRGILVLDFGTALTLDYVDRSGMHRGGFIVASPDLSLRTLHESTAALPLLKAKRSLQLHWPLRTADAMREGQVLSVRGLIREMKILIEKQFHERPFVVMTGGGAPRRGLGPIIYDPHLTLKGLKAWAKAHSAATP